MKQQTAATKSMPAWFRYYQLAVFRAPSNLIASSSLTLGLACTTAGAEADALRPVFAALCALFFLECLNTLTEIFTRLWQNKEDQKRDRTTVNTIDARIHKHFKSNTDKSGNLLKTCSYLPLTSSSFRSINPFPSSSRCSIKALASSSPTENLASVLKWWTSSVWPIKPFCVRGRWVYNECTEIQCMK